jgi:hypothetical protein
MIFFEEASGLKDTNYKINIPLAMSHIIYRNTIVEDFHADGKPLNKEKANILYSDMYNHLLKIEEMRDLALIALEKNHNNEETTEEENLNFMSYLNAMAFSTRCGSNWDQPEDVSKIEYKRFCELANQLEHYYVLEFEEYLEGVIAYLWNGELKKAFDNEIILTNNVMKIINKDIHNKLKYLYDLVVDGYDEDVADLLMVYKVFSKYELEEVESKF